MPPKYHIESRDGALIAGWLSLDKQMIQFLTLERFHVQKVSVRGAAPAMFVVADLRLSEFNDEELL